MEGTVPCNVLSMSVRDAGTGVHFAWNPCSPSPESMFTILGIRVHDALEWMFTFGRNRCSRCPGIPRGKMLHRALAIRLAQSHPHTHGQDKDERESHR